ncbi:MAG: hypothetical protein WBP93_00840, partial [Pyrinomonadaceae bacterium]
GEDSSRKLNRREANMAAAPVRFSVSDFLLTFLTCGLSRLNHSISHSAIRKVGAAPASSRINFNLILSCNPVLLSRFPAFHP